jgi:hypothetical protein
VIRELTEQAEQRPGEIWHAQLRWAIAEMIKVVRVAKAEGLDHVPPERLRRWRVYYDSAVQHGLDLHPVDSGSIAQSKATNLLLRLADRREDYLRFTTDFAVPATNNRAERDLRSVKTQVKISGCHAAETGAANWLAIRSYLSTAVKHGIDAFDAVLRVFTGDLWMPPAELA